MRSVALAAALLWIACGGPEKPAAPTAPAKAAQPDLQKAERENLLDFARGAAVVSRTGESFLANSALQAIDGDPNSFWISPPHDTAQTLTFSLAGVARLTELGIVTSINEQLAPRSVTFEVSRDGTNYVPAGTFTVGHGTLHMFRIAPVEAQYLRVRTTETATRAVAIGSLHARGTPVAPPGLTAIDGCWTINGLGGSFTTSGGATRGSYAMREHPVKLEGSTDGQFYRFVWIRGPQFGTAAVSVTADQQHLSGVVWHEEPIPLFFGDTWFGERSECSAGEAAGAPPSVLEPFLARAGRFPLYALHFDRDGRLDEAASRGALDVVAAFARTSRAFRFVAREFRHDAERNRAISRTKLETLRAALARRGVTLAESLFVAFGSDAPRQKPESEAQRALYGVVEIEIQR